MKILNNGEVTQQKADFYIIVSRVTYRKQKTAFLFFNLKAVRLLLSQNVFENKSIARIVLFIAPGVIVYGIVFERFGVIFPFRFA